MKVTCEECQAEFDDADCNTICPHPLIMPAEDLERKKLAFSLIEIPLRFRGPVLSEIFAPPLYIAGISWNGMVTLRAHERYGEFAPHLFTKYEERKREA
jgi:hypothetical protein